MVSLRVSSYVISIPLEGTNDQYMLIHGYTGAIDIATKELVSAYRKIGSSPRIILRSDGKCSILCGSADI